MDLATAAWQGLDPNSALATHALALSRAFAEAPVAHRSPVAAGLMSAVLPGAGQAYAGRWGEAASALLVNGLLGVATWQLVEHEIYGGAGFTALVGLSFYGGNVMSAVNGARRFDRRAWRARLDPLAAAHGPRAVVEGASLTVEAGP